MVEGVKKNYNTGELKENSTAIPCEATVRIRTANPLSQSKPCTLHISVTSDMKELLEEKYSEYAPALLRQFPTVRHMKDWYAALHMHDRSNALEAPPAIEVGVRSLPVRYALLGLLN